MKKKIKTLTKKEITKVGKSYPEWKFDTKQTKLSRTFEFEKHIDALIFIARSTVNAEIVKHHPDITFTYAKVKMVLTTHEANGLTKLDLELLERIEKVNTGQRVDKK
jgi:4a-hydroxytetrahydrobiopterin dehydratase